MLEWWIWVKVKRWLLKWKVIIIPVLFHPIRGAATGVGGILRDIFTMGARPVH